MAKLENWLQTIVSPTGFSASPIETPTDTDKQQQNTLQTN